ncbi:hypothetical protein [Undibacterium curvum]|uniref:DUF4115 domain-containing protein n=1 Tax=Undibacterium curvum TaxID=2762294 RepID=A0ABR7A4Y2_9BURK|nr:hypothetical protein [Undibacterium curvum]MBC3931964.1 hypothetical protein [Undibacterium curvum]
MGHGNRGRLTVNHGGAWRLYANTLPDGSQAVGTVARGEGDIGALVLMPATGLYVQINANTLRPLDQRKVKAALSGA